MVDAHVLAAEYESSLGDLTFNSKPQINFLTMLAEDNIAIAPLIVQTIEKHLQKVSMEAKLPVLYLVDSILKNVGKEYTALFMQNLVSMFCGAFEKMEEKARSQMFKLRQTWTDVLPAMKLYELDSKVAIIDPAWPVSAPPVAVTRTNSIHLNPKFLNSSTPSPKASRPVATAPTFSSTPIRSAPVSQAKDGAVSEDLTTKQLHLELDRKRMELALLSQMREQQQQQKGKAPLPATMLSAAKNDPVKTILAALPAETVKVLKEKLNVKKTVAPGEEIDTDQFTEALRNELLQKRGLAGLGAHLVKAKQASPAGTIPVSTASAMSPPNQSSASKPVVTKSIVRSAPSPEVVKVKTTVSAPVSSATDSVSTVKSQTAVVKPVTSPSQATRVAISPANPLLINAARVRDPRLRKRKEEKPAESSNLAAKSVPVSVPVSETPIATSNSPVSSPQKASVESPRMKREPTLSTEAVKTEKPEKKMSKDKEKRRKSKKSSKQSESHPSSPKGSRPPAVERDNFTAAPHINLNLIEESCKTEEFSTEESMKVEPKVEREMSVSSPEAVKFLPTVKPVQDVDLRVLPTLPSKKRVSDANGEEPPQKKRKGGMMNMLFGSEDVDLRQLPQPQLPLSSVNLVASTVMASQASLQATSVLDNSMTTSTASPQKPTLTPAASKALKISPEKPSSPKLSSPKSTSFKKESSSRSSRSKSKAETKRFEKSSKKVKSSPSPPLSRTPSPPPPPIISANRDSPLKECKKENFPTWAKVKEVKPDAFKSPYRAPTKRFNPRQELRNQNSSSLDTVFENSPSLRYPTELEAAKGTHSYSVNPHISTNSYCSSYYTDTKHSNNDISQIGERRLKSKSEMKPEVKLESKSVKIDPDNLKLSGRQVKDEAIIGSSSETYKTLEEPPIPPELPEETEIGSPQRAALPEPNQRPELERSEASIIPPPPQPPMLPPPHPLQALPSGQPLPLPPLQLPPHQPMILPVRPMVPQFPVPMRPMMLEHPERPRMMRMMYNHEERPRMMVDHPERQRMMHNHQERPRMMPDHQERPRMMLDRQERPRMMLERPDRPPFPGSRGPVRFPPNMRPGMFMRGGRYSAPRLTSDFAPADPKLLEICAMDIMQTIPIDGVPREIRFYGRTAVIFLANDDPREIRFQDGVRTVVFNEEDSIQLKLNDEAVDFELDGQIHKIRLGAPTRELYIDGKGFPLGWNTPPIKILIDGKEHCVHLEGDTPPVTICTEKRFDLVAGKINLVVDGELLIPIYLDYKPQRFEIDGIPYVLQFKSALQRVKINDRVFMTDFGGKPKPLFLFGFRRFLRLSELPPGIVPGQVELYGMEDYRPNSPPGAHSNSHPPNKTEEDLPHSPSSDNSDGQPDKKPFGHHRFKQGFQHKYSGARGGRDYPMRPEIEKLSGPSDVPSGSQMKALINTGSKLDRRKRPKDSSKEEESHKRSQAESLQSTSLFGSKSINVDELFQKLVAIGIVGKSNTDVKKESTDETEMKLVDFAKPETLKVKQTAMITKLYSGIQCSTCGLRFPPEFADKYSQHLDWHFRQNRRERDSMRTVQSRQWYYDIADWIQFEEIEILEERAQSWFESQVTDEDGREIPGELLSIPAGSDTAEGVCELCHDPFELFFHEETEEWHFRHAIRIDKKLYHPICHQDWLVSLELEAAELARRELEEEENRKLEEEKKKAELKAKEEEEMKVKLEKEEESREKMESKEGTSSQEQIVTVKEEPMEITPEGATSAEVKKEPEMEISDVMTEEPLIESMETDEPQSQEIVIADIEIKKEETDSTVIPDSQVDSTYVGVTSSIDGNVELEESSQVVTKSASNKIKINISKPVLSPSVTEEAMEPEPVPEEPELIPEVTVTIDPNEPFPPGLEPEEPVRRLKPRLVGRKLTEYPPVNKGSELSGLCSIM